MTYHVSGDGKMDRCAQIPPASAASPSDCNGLLQDASRIRSVWGPSTNATTCVAEHLHAEHCITATLQSGGGIDKLASRRYLMRIVHRKIVGTRTHIPDDTAQLGAGVGAKNSSVLHQ
jgi:hypothetical protein